MLLAHHDRCAAVHASILRIAGIREELNDGRCVTSALRILFDLSIDAGKGRSLEGCLRWRGKDG